MKKINVEEVSFDIDGKMILDSKELSSDIETTCLSCGYTEKVPDFIYDEFSRKKYHLKIRKKVSTIACQNCFKETAISSYWLKNKI